jgi:hypothetical protein
MYRQSFEDAGSAVGRGDESLPEIVTVRKEACYGVELLQSVIKTHF